MPLEAKMVGGVARREQGAEAGDRIPVAKRMIGREGAGGARRPAVDRRAGRRLQRGGGADVIGMGMAHQNAPDASLTRRYDGRDMARVIGARIDDGDAALVIVIDQPGVGAMIGHLTGIAGDDTANPRHDRQRDAARRFDFLQEGHGSSCAHAGITLHMFRTAGQVCAR